MWPVGNNKSFTRKTSLPFLSNFFQSIHKSFRESWIIIIFTQCAVFKFGLILLSFLLFYLFRLLFVIVFLFVALTEITRFAEENPYHFCLWEFYVTLINFFKFKIERLKKSKYWIENNLLENLEKTNKGKFLLVVVLYNSVNVLLINYFIVRSYRW